MTIARACLGLAVLALPLLVPPAAAQEPEFYDKPFAENQWTYGRRLDDAQLRYCVDKRDPDWEAAAAIADAVALGLLLEPKRHVVESDVEIADITKVYEVMLEHCDVHLGFKLIPEGYPRWVTLTRPYYEAGYVFVAADPGIASLGDLPPGRPIGATIGTAAHLRLVSYVTALPAEKRWPIFPLGSNARALAALADGTVALALVWAPSFWAAQREDPALAAFRVVAPDPLPPTEMGVGALLLGKETFLRTAVDEAIEALSRDGTIAAILDAYGLPARAVP